MYDGAHVPEALSRAPLACVYGGHHQYFHFENILNDIILAISAIRLSAEDARFNRNNKHSFHR